MFGDLPMGWSLLCSQVARSRDGGLEWAAFALALDTMEWLGFHE
jgi:hypothetical protein